MTISANYPSIRPTLSLDFANEQALDPRVTFSRPTTATYYDAYTSAVAEQNLMLQSQNTGVSPWSFNFGTTVVNGQLAPDGTNTADLITETFIYSGNFQSFSTLNTSTPYTVSFYAKAGTATGSLFVHDDVANVDIGSYTPTSNWARYSFTFTPLNSSVQIYIAQNRSGTGLGTTYIWGVQLEQRSSATAYTATTTTAITNYIPVLQTASTNQPRFDHDPIARTSLGLLIEEQRTNLLTYSSDFSNANWAKGIASVTSAADIAPDGTQTACLEVLSSGGTAANSLRQSFSYVTSTVYTYSMYAKKAQFSTIAFRDNAVSGGFLTFDLTNETSTNGTGGTFYNVGSTAVGNGWYRVYFSFTSTGSIAPFQFGSGSTGDGYSGIYIWGAQLEAGAFPTSYIPTVASQVTRSADSASMTGTNFSSWFNQAQGTLYLNYNLLTSNQSTEFAGFSDNSFSNFISIGQLGTQQLIQEYRSGTSIYYSAFAQAFTSNNKASFTYTNGVLNYVVNSTVASLTPAGPTFAAPVVSQLNIGKASAGAGAINGHILKLAYYPIAVTSVQLQALTGS